MILQHIKCGDNIKSMCLDGKTFRVDINVVPNTSSAYRSSISYFQVSFPGLQHVFIKGSRLEHDCSVNVACNRLEKGFLTITVPAFTILYKKDSHKTIRG